MSSKPAYRPPADYLVLLLCLVMSGLLLSALVRLPSWTLQLPVFGSPLTLGLSGRWFMAILLTLLTAAATDVMVRSALDDIDLDLRYVTTFWVLPSLVTLAAATTVPSQFGDPRRWLVNMVLMGTLLAVVVLAEYGTLSRQRGWRRLSRLVLNVATYGVAFALFASAYGRHSRSLVSATTIVVFAFPLALELLRAAADEWRTTWLYAATVAMIVGELTWVINRWGLSALGGGILLLLAFYVFGGIAQQHLAARLTRRVVLEYVVVAVVGFLAVLESSPWLTGR